MNGWNKPFWSLEGGGSLFRKGPGRKPEARRAGGTNETE